MEAVASQPMWLHWISESGKATRHAPDFFARRTDGTGVLIDVRPDDRITAADEAVFTATAAVADRAGWAYERVGELPTVRAANLRWLAGYRHPRYARCAVMAALADVFVEPSPLRAGAAKVGDPVAVLPVLFTMLWRDGLAADLDSRVLDSASFIGQSFSDLTVCDLDPPQRDTIAHPLAGLIVIIGPSLLDSLSGEAEDRHIMSVQRGTRVREVTT